MLLLVVFDILFSEFITETFQYICKLRVIDVLFVQDPSRKYITMNPSISLQEMIRQAESGNLDAQFALGKMYFGGSNGIVAEDDEKAAYWFELAVKKGCDDAIPPLFVLITTERVIGRSSELAAKMLHIFHHIGITQRPHDHLFQKSGHVAQCGSVNW